MSEEIKNTPEEIEAVKAEDLEDTGSRSCTCDEGKEAQTFL